MGEVGLGTAEQALETGMEKAVEAVEVIGTLDVDALMSYVELSAALLAVAVFLLCLVLGALLGHYAAYRIRG